MSWVEIKPAAKIAPFAKREITMSASAGSGRMSRKVTISVRKEKLPDLLFFDVGNPVKVFIGHGEQTGMLRIVPGNGFLLRSSGGKHSRCPMLVLPEIAGMADGKQALTSVEFDYGGEGASAWLEITLPEWARPAVKQGIVPPASAPAPVTRPPGAPFRGQLAGQPHDVKRGSA